MQTTVTVSWPVKPTARTLQVAANFDVSADQALTRTWQVDAPIEDRDWTIGLVVGPSGAGKSTVARHLFGQHMPPPPQWPPDRALVDCFPAHLSIRDVTAGLNAVGLSSVPAWMRPYPTLSGGERFRADVARALLETPEGGLAVVDEFTSTVDRHVAQVVSAATAKHLRAGGGRRLVAVTCHYDIEDWLQPDWVLQPHIPDFRWRSVQPRPGIELEIREVDASAWKVFRVHHYLTGNAPSIQTWYLGLVAGEPVALAGVGHFPHWSEKTHRIRRARRLVVLPDWQGIGIGTKLEEYLAEMYCAQGYRFRSVTSHPGLVRHYLASPRWRCDARPGNFGNLKSGRNSRKLAAHQAAPRNMLCYSFEYLPRPRPAPAP